MASRESRCMGLTRESGSGLIDHARVKRSVSQWAGRRGRLPGEHELGRLRGETESGLRGYGGLIEVDGVGGHGQDGCSRPANPILGLLLLSRFGTLTQVA